MEPISQEKALHRALFDSGISIIKDATFRYWHWRYKQKKMNPSIIEKILIYNGYEKVESSKWIKKQDPAPAQWKNNYQGESEIYDPTIDK